MAVWSKCTLMQIHAFITIRNIRKIINGFYEPIRWIVFNLWVCVYLHSTATSFWTQQCKQSENTLRPTHVESVRRAQQATSLYLPFEIKRISFAYLVAFMLKIIVMTWTSWQMTATASNSMHTNRNKQTNKHIYRMGSSPLCTCNCHFSFFFWFRLIFIAFPFQLYVVLEPDGKWHYVQHSANKQAFNWRCFWRIYLDEWCLFLIGVQWYLGWFWFIYYQYCFLHYF